MKKGRKIASLIIISLVLVVEFLALVIFTVGIMAEEEMFREMLVCVVYSGLLTAMSVIGLVLVACDKKWVLLSLVGTKIVMFFAFLGAMGGADAKSTKACFILAGFCALLFSVTALIIIFVKRANKKRIYGYNTAVDYNYDDDNCVWDEAERHLKSATDEYCKTNNITFEALTDKDIIQIDRYSVVHMAYLFAWLVKNHFVKDNSRNELVKYDINEYDLNIIANETRDPVYIILHWNGTLFSDILKRDHKGRMARQFISEYIGYKEPRFSNTYVSFYLDDYIATTPSGKMYHDDFSWETYHKLEQRINKNYNRYLAQNDAVASTGIALKVFWPLFGVVLDVYAAEGVSDDYIHKCVKHLLKFSDNLITDMCQGMVETLHCQGYNLDSLISETKKGKLAVKGNFIPDSIKIYNPPIGEDRPAYVILGRGSFDSVHGIGIPVLGDKIMGIDYRIYTPNPWLRYYFT